MHETEFAEFAGPATARLLRLAWLLTGDRHQAQDLVQSALVRTYTSWHRIRDDDAMAYTRKIVVNLHTDWLRRRFWLERSVPEVPAVPDEADGVRRVESRMALVAALQSLGRRERTVVVLRYYLDLSEAETAETLGVTTGTVKSTASRALRKLRTNPHLADSHPLLHAP
jgi:RNA polymerase sigma-70 factor (sigma-E family)